MTVAVKDKKPITVSPAALRRAGFKNGQELEVKVSGGTITIRPKLPVDADYTPAQRRMIDRDLAKGLDDIKHGRLQGPFSSHKEFIDSLHEEARKLGAQKKTKSRLR